jgi:hypothetical protein
MKCAKCAKDVLYPQQHQMGDVFIPLEATTTRDRAIFLPDTIITTSKGIVVNWVVCDECAGKLRDFSDIAFLSISIGLIAFVYAEHKGYLGGRGAFQDFLFPAVLFIPITFVFGVASFWQRLHRRKEDQLLAARDLVLESVIYKLLKRDDFIARYGHVGPIVGHVVSGYSRNRSKSSKRR